MKQIRSSDLIKDIMDRGESYYEWLKSKSGLPGPLASFLASVEFISLGGLDEITMKSAKEDLRADYSEGIGKDDKEVETIRKSIRGSCCFLEVVVYLARSVNEMFSTSSEDKTPKFVEILIKNMGIDNDNSDEWAKIVDHIINREYTVDDKIYVMFPEEEQVFVDNYNLTIANQTKKSLWLQMNEWADRHTDEDGEWLD